MLSRKPGIYSSARKIEVVVMYRRSNVLADVYMFQRCCAAPFCKRLAPYYAPYYQNRDPRSTPS